MPRLVPLALVLLATAASAQPVRLTAVVVDAETGQPLPGATAQVRGETGGATAGPDGRLDLMLPSVPDTVLVRFVGYAPSQVVVTMADVQDGVARRTVRLSSAPYVLGEVTVTDEPPGEVLWRRLLARRQALAGRLGVYAAEGYSRLLLVRDGVTDVRPVPIGLEETLSNLSWSRGAGLREEVVARRRRPDGGPFKWARMGPVPDLYFENTLLLDGRAIPSPTRPDALRDYAFRLGETVEMDGRRYLDLAVIPRRGGLLSGRIRVVDTLLVIAEAELRADPGPRGGAVDDFEATYSWTYEPAWADGLGDSLWLPHTFYREGFVTANLPGYRVPRVRFRQSSVLDLAVPGIPGQATGLGRRYRSPRGVYGGAEVYRVGRSVLPLDSLEVTADESERLRRATLQEMLPRQEGMGVVTPLTAISRALGIDSSVVEGEDDE